MIEGVTNNYTVNNQAPNSFEVMRNRVSTPVKTTTGTLERQPQNDKLELNNSKRGLSKGAKLGIGAVAVLGLGALAYVLTKGKIGSKQVQQLAEHIEFQPAKTIEEAKQFINKNFGVNYVECETFAESDLDTMNFINEWICKQAKTMGKESFPKFIVKDNSGTGIFAYTKLDGYGEVLLFSPKNIDKNLEASLNHVRNKSKLYLKDEHGNVKIANDFDKVPFIESIVERVNKLSNNSTALSYKEKMQLALDIKSSVTAVGKENGKYKFRTPSVFEFLDHEQGHMLHNRITPDFEKLATYAHEVKDLPKVVEEFINSKEIQAIARKVSPYAKISPAEFVAETYAQMKAGHVFSEDVVALYRKYNGPSL